MIATTTQPISRTGVSIHPTAPIFSTILPSRRLNPKSLPRALSQPELCPQLRAWLPFRVWGHPRKGKGRRAKASRSAPLCFVAGSASARPRTRRLRSSPSSGTTSINYFPPSNCTFERSYWPTNGTHPGMNEPAATCTPHERLGYRGPSPSPTARWITRLYSRGRTNRLRATLSADHDFRSTCPM